MCDMCECDMCECGDSGHSQILTGVEGLHHQDMNAASEEV